MLKINMASPSSGKRRKDSDVIKLMASEHEVTVMGGLDELMVKFRGPEGTLYQGGIWQVLVQLPDQYPFRGPYIRFRNKIYHPNIAEVSGSVCLDVVNDAWTALYDLNTIFETFLPQLLMYPNAEDPLNCNAAALYIHRPKEYTKKVTQFVRKFASEEVITIELTDTESESSMSEFSDDEPEDMEM